MKNVSLFLCLILAACASDPRTIYVCPKLKTYTQSEQLNQAAAEDMLPVNSPLDEPLLEWAQLRSELKVCQ